MDIWTIESHWIKAEVQSLGGMLGPAWFRLHGRLVQPLAVGAWAEDCDARHAALPGLLQRLRGEWPCVPFGMPVVRADLPAEWQTNHNGAPFVDSQPHGFSSNAHWQLSERREYHIELVVEYPSAHPVKRLRRIIQASHTEPLLKLRLIVEARAACELPIALHPTFRLPATPRGAALCLGPEARAWTSPVSLEPGIACFKPNVRDMPLEKIPLQNGVEDITRLPLPYAAEEILLITGHQGRATLDNLEEQYTVTLSWDREVFPACQLWLSNCGRHSYPWNGRFLALGIEPVRAAFDYGTLVSRNRRNPLWLAGVTCLQAFSPERPFETEYSVAVSARQC